VSPIGRRSLLLVAAVAIAVPLLAATQDRPPASLRFAPPSTPLLYTRRLERELAGGARFTVSRSFAVRFVREAGGFLVDGEQVAVAVEAPPQLEALARLERERVESALFPLQLDMGGTIRGLSRAADSTQLDAAVREVAAQIEQGQHAPAEREQLRAFVDAVHRSAGELLTELPSDLFAPVNVPRDDRRAIVLPGGATGQVRTTFSAERDAVTGLMREARREVVTEVAGDMRRTVESWTLEPLP
jgi:hypothetical protein